MPPITAAIHALRPRGGRGHRPTGARSPAVAARTPPRASLRPSPRQELLDDAWREQIGRPPAEPGRKGFG